MRLRIRYLEFKMLPNLIKFDIYLLVLGWDIVGCIVDEEDMVEDLLKDLQYSIGISKDDFEYLVENLFVSLYTVFA